MTDYDIVFLKPLKFEDCLKCIEYIKEEKILHINLSELEQEKSQRVLDFVSGAIHIQNGQIINPADKIYCTIPKSKSYQIEYKENPNVRFDEEEEIIPRYNKK